MPDASDVLKFDEQLTLLPVVHGSADSAWQVRQWLLQHPPQCLAIPLPASFFKAVCEGVLDLPQPSIVLQAGQRDFTSNSENDSSDFEFSEWQPEENEFESNDFSNTDGDGEEARGASEEIDHDNENTQEEDDFSDEDNERERRTYVPLDPCQPVIAAIRLAMEERWRIEFVDMESADYIPFTQSLPDAYALKHLPLEKFAAACLPWLPPPSHPLIHARLQYQADRLHELKQRYQSVTMLCSLPEWPWLRERIQLSQPNNSISSSSKPAEPDEPPSAPERFAIDPRTLLFLFGELPFITALYEQHRMQLEDDRLLGIDGIKHLMLSARSSYLQDFGKRARRITPLIMSQCLKYIRNLSLINHRLTPDLYTIVTACQQILGDQFAIHVVNTAREYAFAEDSQLPMVKLGIDQAQLPDGDRVDIVSRLPGPPVTWKSLELRKQPDKQDQQKWASQWNPYQQCSWPPEDQQIESFRTRVFERARAIMGADLARTEKFSTSILDGIDIRETIRHWYDGDIYVKVLPPSVGTLDACVMLFESSPDPRQYPWRTTWYAEHQEESTLAFFATDYRNEMVGPGIAQATYGGAMFIYPPMPIPDIWSNRQLDFTNTLEDRLIAATCLHCRGRHVALMSPNPPGANLRRLAKRFGKKLVHVPLSQFNDATIQQLRMVHVLNGKEVRSFASHFIRKA
jgi:hypothetical protein